MKLIPKIGSNTKRQSQEEKRSLLSSRTMFCLPVIIIKVKYKIFCSKAGVSVYIFDKKRYLRKIKLSQILNPPFLVHSQ